MNRIDIILLISISLSFDQHHIDVFFWYTLQVAAIAAMCVQTEADYRPLITDVVQSLMPLVKNQSLPGSSGQLKFGHTPSPRQ